jgi:hypothetical protein
MSTKSVEEFYNDVNIPLPENFKKEIGHFNVFAIDEFIRGLQERSDALQSTFLLQNQLDYRQKSC